MRRFILFFIALAAATCGYAQLTASNSFSDAPASVMPLLDRNTRLDMIDYFNSGSSTPSKNAMQGQSRITSLSPVALSAQITGSSECQLALLPMKSDTIIMYIETVRTPTPDSRIKFYDRMWKPAVSGVTFAMPSLDEWVVADKKDAKSAVATLVPFMLSSAEYDAGSAKLTLTNRLSEFMSPDVYSQVSAYLLPSLTYTWDGNNFRRNK